MAKLLFVALLASAIATGIVSRPDPPLLIDSSSGPALLDAHG